MFINDKEYCYRVFQRYLEEGDDYPYVEEYLTDCGKRDFEYVTDPMDKLCMYCNKPTVTAYHLEEHLNMSKGFYHALFLKCKNGYSVLFPDIMGGTCGDTYDEALYMANGFLEAVYVNSVEDNHTMPVQNIDSIIEDLEEYMTEDDWEEIRIVTTEFNKRKESNK